MRCPACGARNSEDATWCTQCYADVSAAGASPEPAGVPAPTAPRAAAATPAAPARRDVRDREGVIEWRCTACDGWSPLEAANCVVCGTPRQGFGEEAPTDRAVSDTGVVAASFLLPGLGHVLAGRSGTGLARAILAVLWLLGGIVLSVGNPGIRALPGWLLIVAAAVLWVATVVDAQRLVAGDDRQLLSTRRLGGLVIAVTIGLVLAAGLVVLVSA